MTTKKYTGKFVLGTLVGGIVGSITALLIAPHSGDKTQKLILEKGESWRQDAENRLIESQQHAEEKFEQVRNSIAEWLSKGSTLLDDKSQQIMLEKSTKTA